MPIVKCEASKATPMKGLAYIMDKEKTLAKGSIGFLTDDPEQMARQMMQTMYLHGKGKSPNERKYYHCKISFDPQDLKQNGGELDERMANRYAAKYAAKTWPGREVAWSVQHHGTAMHIHFIVAACEQETGKKLDARDAEYRRWKNRAQDLAAEMGLSTLDWEKATAEKRAGEIQADLPVTQTFAEQGLQARGKTSWKDELRSIIDRAAGSCRSMDEFQAYLQSQGVTLTRSTGTTISYKLGEHKACRGDTLGGDYTAQAIRDALQHNSQEPAPEQGKEHAGIYALIGSASRRSDAQAAGGRVIDREERDMYRQLGRLAGVKRAEIDEMCDRAEMATWDEKKEAWAQYQEAKTEFWEEYAIRQQALKMAVDDAYKRRRKVKNAEWALDPRNRRKSLFGVIYAGIVLSRNDTRGMIEREIETLKREQRTLRQDMASFKAHTEDARGTLKEKGLSLDAYMASVQRMQGIADYIQKKNAALLDVEAREKARRAAEKAKAARKPSGPHR